MPRAKLSGYRLERALEEQRQCIARQQGEIVMLRKLLERAYKFISPNHDPSGLSNTEMAADIGRVLKQ